MSVEHAELHCETCDLDTEHELHYAGRLLESTRCTRCGTHLEVSQRALLAGVRPRPRAAHHQQAATDVAAGPARPLGLPDLAAGRGAAPAGQVLARAARAVCAVP